MHGSMLKSIVCRQEHFRSEWFALWSERMGFPAPATQHLHRKVWEWAAISQALWERGVLRGGRRGLGFAVGTERVVSMFAGLGATIEATDLYAGEKADFWKGSDEYAVSRDALFRPEMLDRDEFERRVTFYNADMNDLSQFERGSYDFIWSSCAVEHVGSLEKATAFLKGAAELLKPGGVAVHTTELNMSSLDDLFDDGGMVIFREQDLRRIDREMRANRCCIENLDLEIGSEPMDVGYDVAPYNNGPHVKIQLCGHIVTSALLICRKF
jgi:SAM-dependent methyltransferase